MNNSKIEPQKLSQEHRQALRQCNVISTAFTHI